MGQDQHEMGLAELRYIMARKKLFLISRVGGSMPDAPKVEEFSRPKTSGWNVFDWPLVDKID